MLNNLIGGLITIAIGFVLWKIIPGKITAGSKRVRGYIDLGAQILGIILMVSGVIQIVRSFLTF